MSLLTYRGTVYPWHCDHIGHMNVMWYAGKFDEASWNLLACVGLTPAYLTENARGVVAVEQHVAYRQELKAGDTMLVHSDLIEVRQRAIRFRHVMSHAVTAEVCAVTTITGVHLDMTTRKSCPLPSELANAARALITPDTTG